MGCRLDAAPHFFSDELHAVTDPENRRSQFEDGRIADGCIRFIDGCRPSRQDDALGVLRFDFIDRRVERNDLGIDIRFANSSSDQLCVLSAEIEDEYRFKLRRHFASLYQPHRTSRGADSYAKASETRQRHQRFRALPTSLPAAL